MKTQRISAWLSLVLAVAIALLSVGCSGSEQQVSSLGERQQPYYTFTDDTGYAVVLEQKPQKVAVLFSSYAEIWQLAGGDVAVTGAL